MTVSPSLLSAREAEGQRAHPLILWAALVVHLHVALVPIPPTVLVAYRRKIGQETARDFTTQDPTSSQTPSGLQRVLTCLLQ